MFFYNKKQQIFSLAVVIYFFIYASSPLLYTSDKRGQAQSRSATKKAAALSADLHIFIYDLIFSTLTSERGKETSGPISGFLSLKKRAILSDDSASTLTRLNDEAELNEHLTFSTDFSSSISTVSADNSCENFPRSFQGCHRP